METCRKAVKNQEYVLHEAALGSVPRSINDPITTNVDNVVQMNLRALTTTNPEAVNQVYNTAFGERTTLNQLLEYLKEYLSAYDKEIAKVEVLHGPNRAGDIPHSLANVDKAKNLLNYNPKYSMKQGLKQACDWYWENLR